MSGYSIRGGKEAVISELAHWKRSLTASEVSELVQGQNIEKFVHVVVQIEREDGFLNRLLLRKRFVVYLNGVYQLTMPIRKNSTTSWWSKISW